MSSFCSTGSIAVAALKAVSAAVATSISISSTAGLSNSRCNETAASATDSSQEQHYTTSGLVQNQCSPPTTSFLLLGINWNTNPPLHHYVLASTKSVLPLDYVYSALGLKLKTHNPPLHHCLWAPTESVKFTHNIIPAIELQLKHNPPLRHYVWADVESVQFTHYVMAAPKPYQR